MSNTRRCYLSGRDLSAGAAQGSSRASVMISRFLLLSFSEDLRTRKHIADRPGDVCRFVAPAAPFVTLTAARIGTRPDSPATSVRSSPETRQSRDRVELSWF